ncbi:tetratricopeptide repeat protein [Deinococcus aerius]|uniref:tetratricopeptide repeat protein n=1 Tax=Deinococcus aerius TaxID=200253 RepID=UPI001F4817DE|nr:tetratricopeptide repeat protein [Deinococcus aerius]
MSGHGQGSAPGASVYSAHDGPRPPTEPLTAEPPRDWTAFARAGEWRRALAAARLAGAPPEVVAALDGAVGVQDGVRARRPGQARRSWAATQEALEAARARGLTGEAALLTSLLSPGTLTPALAALEGLGNGSGGETEPGALRERLTPAFAHPLTRAEALNAVGVLHALREEPGEARGAFEEALGTDPSHYRAITNIGNLELEAGQPGAAETRYREVLRLNPDYDGAHHNLGVALRRQGKVYESVGSIRRAQRLSVKRSQEDTREEMREQFRTNARLRTLRWVLLAAAVLILFLIVRGAGH